MFLFLVERETSPQVWMGNGPRGWRTYRVWGFAACGLERRSGLNNLVVMYYTNRLDQWQPKMLEKKGFVSGVATGVDRGEPESRRRCRSLGTVA